MRGQIISLKDIVDPGSILRLWRAELEDIELLACVEEEMGRIYPQGKT